MTSLSHHKLLEQEFHDPALNRRLLAKLVEEIDTPLRFMEVCGTHTVSIFRSGLRSVLPPSITHLSGPGCPVCVTHDREIALFCSLAQEKDIIIATFGDLLRVPGPQGVSLKHLQAQGASVHIVYSPLDALALARSHSNKKVVFLGVGFETTAPTVAAAVHMAKAEGLKNFFVLCCHKLVPPALEALLTASEGSPHGIDAFLLPGHVATIMGSKPYEFIATTHGKPGIIAGFAPADILQSLLVMLDMRKQGRPGIYNQYSRAASDEGNPKARQMMHTVFRTVDALWRGLGTIPHSGLALHEDYRDFDALKQLQLSLPEVAERPGCRCGDVLRGRITPRQCPLFGSACTPASPVGPCMVSTEGSCAASHAYDNT